MVGCSQRDAVIDAPVPPELLKVDARHKAAETVADQVDPTPSHTPPQVVSKADRTSFDALTRRIVEGEYLANPAPAEVAGKREQGRSIREIAVNQYDRSLRRFAGRAASWSPETERE